MKEKDKILIVQDDEDTRFILEKLLQLNNYDVRAAKDGLEALQIISEYNPKVIIADWTMPRMDGIELCTRLKENPATKVIYFILLTARASTKDVVSGFDSGADDFLVKPIDNQEILARLRAGIRIYDLQNELQKVQHSKALVELACTLGHQINNPLSGLILSFNNIKDELKDTQIDALKDDIMIIEKSIERINNSVKTLINLQNPEIISYAGDNNMIKI
ncbi:MAG TPA: response regulator [Ignavibacteriales bacterium]|nr:response regulator [Ignavibacteriales bacterium]HOL81300.1 response regulator [Ignavibacteriales bacterium]HOM66044.1 response regulator [Ignavibacteriales bacterium]HPD67536.1 response regulator [Ignavibacteriales bacterium]HPP33410.1 response regulator [Ignavibacteriales bacterium]